LGNTISKTTAPLTLWKTAKGLVEVDRNALVLPVMLGDRLKGYIFQGNGRLVLDMIIETEEGAIGRPVENRTGYPFMMLGRIEVVHDGVCQASQEDLAGLGYTRQQEFVSEAEDLLDRFHGRSLGLRSCGFSSASDGAVFAFQKGTDDLDILMTEGEKIVYKAEGTVFISNENKVVLKDPNGLVCISNGKSVIVKA
jgi:hypothetical protein